MRQSSRNINTLHTSVTKLDRFEDHLEDLCLGQVECECTNCKMYRLGEDLQKNRGREEIFNPS